MDRWRKLVRAVGI